MDNVRRNSPYHSGTSQYVPHLRIRTQLFIKDKFSCSTLSRTEKAQAKHHIQPRAASPEPEESRRKPFVPQINNSQSHLLSPSRSSAKSPIRGVSPSRQTTNRPVTITSPMRSSQQEYTYELSAPADLGLSRSVSQSQYRSPSKGAKLHHQRIHSLPF